MEPRPPALIVQRINNYATATIPSDRVSCILPEDGHGFNLPKRYNFCTLNDGLFPKYYVTFHCYYIFVDRNNGYHAAYVAESCQEVDPLWLGDAGGAASSPSYRRHGFPTPVPIIGRCIKGKTMVNAYATFYLRSY